MIVYFDTSAVVKLLLDESGSMLAREMWNGSEPATSIVTGVEVRSALARAARIQRITEEERAAATDRVDELLADTRQVSVDGGVIRRAGAIAEEHGLRGFDAIQLASAEAVLGTGYPRLMVGWDEALANAAYAERISTVREPVRSAG